MKRILFLMMGVAVAMCAAAVDRFYIEDFSIEKGVTLPVGILLENETVYTAFQCDLYLPEGLTATNVKLTSRKHSSHTLSVIAQPDGALRLLSYSLQLKPYSGTSGALVTMDITAADTFTGPAVIALRNVMFSNLMGEEVPLDDAECTVTTPTAALPGDVDEDGIITIGDATALIDHLLGGTVLTFNAKNADVDQDGNITIGDVTAIIDQLLSK